MSSENAHSPTISRAGVADIPQIRARADVAFPATYAAIITPEQTAYMMQMMYAEEVLRREMTELDIAWFIARQADGVPSGFVSIGRDDSHIATAAPGAPTVTLAATLAAAKQPERRLPQTFPFFISTKSMCSLPVKDKGWAVGCSMPP